MREEGMSVEDTMQLLNSHSGLLGVSGKSLDTRVLTKEYGSNSRVRLATDMFSYRLRKAVGAYLAILGNVDALIFGGGIAENTKVVRQYVCEGLRSFGIEMDREANERLIDVEGRLSVAGSKTEAWILLTEEERQIAHECCQVSQ
jgi:acetate kinase